MFKRLLCLMAAVAMVALAFATTSPASASRGPNLAHGGAPNAVALSGLIFRADVPLGHDYYTSNCVSGEAANVCGYWSVNNTPDGAYWTLVKDAKWNIPGGPSQVSFRSISHSGYILPWRTMNNNNTHCWFPHPVYDGYPTAPCGAYGETHATAFDGAGWANTYKVTVDPSSGGTSCYVLTPFVDTIVSGTCPN